MNSCTPSLIVDSLSLEVEAESATATVSSSQPRHETQIPPGWKRADEVINPRWHYFYRSVEKGSGNRYRAMCEHCSEVLDGKPDKLEHHVLHRCTLTSESRVEYMRIVERSSKRHRMSMHSSGLESQPVFLPQHQQQRLSKFFSPPMKAEVQETHHMRFLDFLVSSNSAFNVCSNKELDLFIRGLNPSYVIPSRRVVSDRLLQKRYSECLLELGDQLKDVNDVTLTMDGWEDVSNNSIYAVIAITSTKQWILDIVHFTGRPTANALLQQLLLSTNKTLLRLTSIVAFVSDSPTTMIRLRSNLVNLHPNMVPLRCCLHQLNLITKDVSAQCTMKQVFKKNCKLINFFTSSHYWTTQLKTWGRENNVLKFLSSFCETRWYSAVLVCVGVASYHKGFQHCVDKSRLANEPPINKDISNLVDDDYHFAINKEICKLIKPIADSIARLEQSSTTLDQVFAELINLYTTVKDVDVTSNCSSFKTHIIKTIRKRASEFDHPIYFVALFLNPKYQSLAISRKKNYNDIRKDIGHLAKGWKFTKMDTISLLGELNDYINRSGVFTNISNRDFAIDFWQSVVGAKTLRVFAMKLFSITPHNAAVERLFSQLTLSKTKIRNRMTVERMKMLSIIRSSLKEHSKPSSTSSRSLALDQESSFSIALEDDEDFSIRPADELSLEDLELTLDDNDDFQGDFDMYFDFAKYQLESSPNVTMAAVEKQVERTDEEDWSVDDLLS